MRGRVRVVGVAVILQLGVQSSLLTCSVCECVLFVQTSAMVCLCGNNTHILLMTFHLSIALYMYNLAIGSSHCQTVCDETTTRVVKRNNFQPSPDI